MTFVKRRSVETRSRKDCFSRKQNTILSPVHLADINAQTKHILIEAFYWVGTTGRVLPFSPEQVYKCFHCGMNETPIVCQDCQIACYCSEDCQESHMKAVHHRTCGKFCPTWTPSCPVCSKELSNADETHRKQCNLCRKVHYCSRECRRCHWKHVHRAECPREFSVTGG